MAPQLWMLRHGEAVPHDSKPDPERELTPHGRHQAEAAGAALAAINEEFSACYASPQVRAWETAASSTLPPAFRVRVNTLIMMLSPVLFM